MGELFSQLGVEPVALLWQMANFAIVLFVLYRFVYTPLTALVAERTKKIQEGIATAQEAKEELLRVEAAYNERMRRAETEALALIRQAEGEAEGKVKHIIARGEARDAAMLAEARTLAERVRAEEMEALEGEAAAFVRSVVEKTVALDPSAIDTKLIDEAVRMVKALPQT